MIDIKGIETQSNLQGEITHITLEVEKYKDILEPILEQLAQAQKTDFDKKWATGIGLEDARKKTHEYIRKMWKK